MIRAWVKLTLGQTLVTTAPPPSPAVANHETFERGPGEAPAPGQAGRAQS
jgi:hypothetical protein